MTDVLADVETVDDTELDGDDETVILGVEDTEDDAVELCVVLGEVLTQVENNPIRTSSITLFNNVTDAVHSSGFESKRLPLASQPTVPLGAPTPLRNGPKYLLGKLFRAAATVLQLPEPELLN